MKGLKLLFAVCLAPLAFYGAWADDAADIARAAARRGVQNTSQQSTQTNSRTHSGTRGTDATSTKSTPDTASRTISSGVTRDRATTTRPTGNAKATPDTTPTPSVTSRPGTSATKTRTATQSTSRGNAVSRTATTPVTATTRSGTTTVATRTRNTTPSRTASRTIARVATDKAPDTPKMSTLADQKKCRDVFYGCMDEFCANKDANLGRCACSARTHEFDRTRKNLSSIEDKMLTFNQRLLTVNMDKEDAIAITQATEGELAFNQRDTSASKKMLDDIAKKLNTSFNDSNFDRRLNAISLSLDTDAAFDSIDSLRGSGTTAKSGTELYAAALPVCREMAMEVCTTDELTIAEGGYQMVIEQDCNTVLKSYQAKTNQARDNVRDGSALLDMSRLNAYQTRNSDDILTCKKKMLDMLTDSSVCGTDMGKCLDISGQYIDPTTGQAFLTQNLVNLGTLISRPDDNTTWARAPGNDAFVSFLNTRRKYLAPAMENCQDIADTVWDAFIEDALAQIKLAQTKKLEDMRQSCTTLTTQCLTDAEKSLSDFDARALSIFGVTADKTATVMCSEITTACTALLNTTFADDGTPISTDNTWESGMTQIANTKTYESILHTCREVGRSCIIRACTSLSGNFGLCENIQTSVNRKSIINRSACWDEVLNCVAGAGDDKITAIIDQLKTNGTYSIPSGTNLYSFYNNLYDNFDLSGETNCTTSGENDKQCINDICDTYCSTTNQDNPECYKCRIAEQIWGNCEAPSYTPLAKDTDHNKILVPTKDATATLLSWFAKNTGTMDSADNCRDTSCPAGQILLKDEKNENKYVCSDASIGSICSIKCTTGIYDVVPNTIRNCCAAPQIDTHGHCPAGEHYSTMNLTDITPLYSTDSNITTPYNVLVPDANNTLVATWENNNIKYSLICSGESAPNDLITTSDNTITCHGKYILVTSDGYYYQPGKTTPDMTNYIERPNADSCKNPYSCYYQDDTGWLKSTTPTESCGLENQNTWSINFE